MSYLPLSDDTSLPRIAASLSFSFKQTIPRSRIMFFLKLSSGSSLSISPQASKANSKGLSLVSAEEAILLFFSFGPEVALSLSLLLSRLNIPVVLLLCIILLALARVSFTDLPCASGLTVGLSDCGLRTEAAMKKLLNVLIVTYSKPVVAVLLHLIFFCPSLNLFLFRL